MIPSTSMGRHIQVSSLDFSARDHASPVMTLQALLCGIAVNWRRMVFGALSHLLVPVKVLSDVQTNKNKNKQTNQTPAVYCAPENFQNATWIQTLSVTTANGTCNPGYYSPNATRACLQNDTFGNWSTLVANACGRKCLFGSRFTDIFRYFNHYVLSFLSDSYLLHDWHLKQQLLAFHTLCHVCQLYLPPWILLDQSFGLLQSDRCHGNV